MYIYIYNLYMYICILYIYQAATGTNPLPGGLGTLSLLETSDVVESADPWFNPGQADNDC